jgi:hypothetical protein
MSTPPDSRKSRAVQLLEELQSSLETDSLDDAVSQAQTLYEHLRDWQKTEHIRAARQWLDEAIQEDALAFDSRSAREHLARWQAAIEYDPDNPPPELAHYQERVETCIQEKQDALQIRGVMSHCGDLLDEASTLEAGDDPPHPDFMMTNYYEKARRIALSAQSDYDDNTDLDRLVQRVERIYNNKDTAAHIYEMALEQRKYTNALHNLDQLPDETLVPRYTATEDSLGAVKLNYQEMVSARKARQEIREIAQTWATDTVQKAIETAQRQLNAHAPEEAVGTLELSDNMDKFLDDDLKQELTGIQSKAKTSLRNRQKAEDRAQKALELANDEPLAAWDEYASAYHTYQWVDEIQDARKAILKAIENRLHEMIAEADEAFHQQRDMQRVRDICQKAQSQYGDKDASLNDLLSNFNDYNEMADRYDEYIQTGNEILDKVGRLIDEDIVAANDLLSQVESYPDIVLEAFDNLYELRQRINHRLDADHRYSQLYPLLFKSEREAVHEGIETLKTTVQEFPDDTRFPSLLKALQVHLAFISAKEQAAVGANEQALQLLAPALNSSNHPDHDAARNLRDKLQNARQE